MPGVSWLDWRGETAVIVATGPSAKEVPLAEIEGLARVIVINSSWRLALWADLLYGCDRFFWIENRGVPKFKGMKASSSPTACKVYPEIRMVTLKPRAEILTGEIGQVGCGLRTGGGHSGFHAMNLAVQFGCKRIVLVGFDMGLAQGAHWHEPILGAHRLEPKAMAENRAALDGCAGQFAALGVEVVNASPKSALKNYRFVDLVEAVNERHSYNETSIRI